MITLGMAGTPAGARADHDASILEIRPDDTDRALVERAEALGLEVMGYYDGDDPSVFAAYLDAGVHYLNLDHLDVAGKLLGHRATPAARPVQR
jgi:hypothetical protein